MANLTNLNATYLSAEEAEFKTASIGSVDGPLAVKGNISAATTLALVKPDVPGIIGGNTLYVSNYDIKMHQSTSFGDNDYTYEYPNRSGRLVVDGQLSAKLDMAYGTTNRVSSVVEFNLSNDNSDAWIKLNKPSTDIVVDGVYYLFGGAGAQGPGASILSSTLTKSNGEFTNEILATRSWTDKYALKKTNDTATNLKLASDHWNSNKLRIQPNSEHKGSEYGIFFDFGDDVVQVYESAIAAAKPLDIWIDRINIKFNDSSTYTFDIRTKISAKYISKDVGFDFTDVGPFKSGRLHLFKNDLTMYFEIVDYAFSVMHDSVQTNITSTGEITDRPVLSAYLEVASKEYVNYEAGLKSNLAVANYSAKADSRFLKLTGGTISGDMQQYVKVDESTPHVLRMYGKYGKSDPESGVLVTFAGEGTENPIEYLKSLYNNPSHPSFTTDLSIKLYKNDEGTVIKEISSQTIEFTWMPATASLPVRYQYAKDYPDIRYFADGSVCGMQFRYDEDGNPIPCLFKTVQNNTGSAGSSSGAFADGTATQYAIPGIHEEYTTKFATEKSISKLLAKCYIEIGGTKYYLSCDD